MGPGDPRDLICAGTCACSSLAPARIIGDVDVVPEIFPEVNSYGCSRADDAEGASD
jgi:hypothetical protein